LIPALAGIHSSAPGTWTRMGPGLRRDHEWVIREMVE